MVVDISGLGFNMFNAHCDHYKSVTNSDERPDNYIPWLKLLVYVMAGL